MHEDLEKTFDNKNFAIFLGEKRKKEWFLISLGSTITLSTVNRYKNDYDIKPLYYYCGIDEVYDDVIKINKDFKKVKTAYDKLSKLIEQEKPSVDEDFEIKTRYVTVKQYHVEVMYNESTLYYSTLTGALKGLSDRIIFQSRIKSVEDLLEVIASLKPYIQEIITDIKNTQATPTVPEEVKATRKKRRKHGESSKMQSTAGEHH